MYYATVFEAQESGSDLAWWLWVKISHKVAVRLTFGAVVMQGSTVAARHAFELTHVLVDRPLLIDGHDRGLCPSLLGLLHGETI